MARRRPRLRRAGPPADEQRRRLEALRGVGWVVPRPPAGQDRPAWTLVGTVDSSWVTAVDPAGLVTPFGLGPAWSLDWWIGADDRWHFPSAEAGVRQHLVGDAPVVETLVRIPGGDAVQRVYGMRGEAFAGGDEWVVIEVENRSSVPFAIAFAVRPLTPEGVAPVSAIDMAAVAGGQHRDPAHTVTIDGRPAMVLSRRPARIAAGCGATGDAAAAVSIGDAVEVTGESHWTGPRCPDGLAQTAFIFPVAHATTMRVLLPVAAETGAAVAWPPVIPDAGHVVAGWEAHAGRAMRMDIPDPQLSEMVEAGRRSLLLAPWSEGARHAGPVRSSPPAGGISDTGRILATLDRLGHHAEVARTLREWPEHLVGRRDDAGDDIAVVEAVATHRLLAGDGSLFDALLPDVVAAVSRLDRRASRNRAGAAGRRRTVRALETLAMALDAAGQRDGAADVRSVVARLDAVDAVAAAMDAATSRPPRVRLAAAVDAILEGHGVGLDLLRTTLIDASPTFGFSGPGEPHDLVATALGVDATRALLVQESARGLDLLRVFPSHWYGGPVELHDAPTAHGTLSYALRWHGTRPALLWELVRPEEGEPVRITVSGLDAAWATTQPRGEALLAEVAPPAGSEPVRLITEHPGDGGTFA